MKTIQTLEEGNKKAKIQEGTDEGITSYLVICTQDDNATHNFPFKYYSTLKWAENYAKKFLNS